MSFLPPDSFADASAVPMLPTALPDLMRPWQEAGNPVADRAQKLAVMIKANLENETSGAVMDKLMARLANTNPEVFYNTLTKVAVLLERMECSFFAEYIAEEMVLIALEEDDQLMTPAAMQFLMGLKQEGRLKGFALPEHTMA